MAFNLLETVSGLFNNDLVSKAASSLGESEGGIAKAMSGIIPSVLAGLLNKAGSGGNAASSIFSMAQDAAGSGMLGNLAGMLGGGLKSGGGSGLLNMASSIFGDKLGNVGSLISNFSGIKASSASSLLSMAAPAALGAIGKHASANNLNAGGLLSMLASQKDNILKALPAGLGLASALGLGSLGDIGNKLSGTISGVAGGAKKGMKWLIPVVIAVVAIGLLIYFMKSCKNEVRDKDTTATIAPIMADAPSVSIASYKVKLPDGSELDALKGGIEDKLVAFLNDANTKAGKDVWFDFDNLNFETGSANITAESQAQVKNIAAILKAFSKTKIKIGGYTDKTGDAAANKKLSQSRADAVVAALTAAGANAGQIEAAEGYGAEFAKAAADAPEEERKKDRKISVGIREK
jgi:outer membrane protein OmpA-like peptidoglycan-associated protein